MLAMHWTHALVMALINPCSIISFFCMIRKYSVVLVHSYFLHDKEIFCHFGSFLVNSCHFYLTSSVSAFLLVELVVIKHGSVRYVVSCTYQQPQGGCFCGMGWDDFWGWDVFLIPDTARRAALCIQHYLVLVKYFHATPPTHERVSYFECLQYTYSKTSVALTQVLCHVNRLVVY